MLLPSESLAAAAPAVDRLAHQSSAPPLQASSHVNSRTCCSICSNDMPSRGVQVKRPRLGVRCTSRDTLVFQCCPSNCTCARGDRPLGLKVPFVSDGNICLGNNDNCVSGGGGGGCGGNVIAAARSGCGG